MEDSKYTTSEKITSIASNNSYPPTTNQPTHLHPTLLSIRTTRNSNQLTTVTRYQLVITKQTPSSSNRKSKISSNWPWVHNKTKSNWLRLCSTRQSSSRRLKHSSIASNLLILRESHLVKLLLERNKNLFLMVKDFRVIKPGTVRRWIRFLMRVMPKKRRGKSKNYEWKMSEKKLDRIKSIKKKNNNLVNILLLQMKPPKLRHINLV